MFFAKHRKAIIGLSIVAVMSLGITTAFAATTGASLTPVAGRVDMSNVKIAGSLEIVEGTVLEIADATSESKTLPAPSLVAVSDFDIADVTDVQEGTFTVAEEVIPAIAGTIGEFKTLPAPLLVAAEDIDISDIVDTQDGAFTIAEGITPEVFSAYTDTTTKK